jgi:hypothetical protein
MRRAAVALAIIIVAAAIALWRAGRERKAPTAASRPITTAPTSAPATQAVATTKPAAGSRTWLDLVRAAYPAYPATQPLDLPSDLSDAAHVVISDPIYLDRRHDLWVTRADADPTPDVLRRAFDEQVHVVRDKVRFVHWSIDQRGKWNASIIHDASGDLAQGKQPDWSRAFDWNDDIVVPTKDGVAVLHSATDRAADFIKIDPGQSRIEVIRTPRALVAYAAWDNGKTGSTSAARYLDGKWTTLQPSDGWPTKLVQLVPLLDGSVAQLFINDEGKFDVAIAPVVPGTAPSSPDEANPAIDAKKVQSLVEQLSDADPAKREDAFAQLTRYGPGIFPLLEKLEPNQPAEARARIDELLKAKVNPTLGGMTLHDGPLITAARLSDGGAVFYSEAGVALPHAGDEPETIAPAWIAIRPGWPVRLLPEMMAHDLQPGRQKIEAFLDEWIVTDDVQGPRRFAGNHFDLLLRKSERKYSDFIGIDRRGRWLFKAKTGATLLLDPTIPDPQPRLPVWEWSTPDGKVGWTLDNWPAVQKGGTWVLGATGWRPLDEKKEKFITELPEAPPPPPTSAPTTASTRSASAQIASTEPAELPIFTDKDGTRYYDGQRTLRIVKKDGQTTTWPLPPNAAGTGDAWLVHSGDQFFLFNQAGRIVRFIPTAGATEPFRVDAVFTRHIPNTDSPQRVWLDPAGRIIIAHDGTDLAIIFPTGRVPSEIAKMMPEEKPDEE